MIGSRWIGQALGVLLLVQLAGGLILPYVFLLPVSTPAGAFLASAAGMQTTIKLSVLMLLIGGAASLAIAVLVWPLVRERHEWLGLWLLSLAVINLTLQLVENTHWLTLLSISEAYATAGTGDADMYRVLGVAAHSAFRWAHYSHILTVVAWLFILFLLLYRSAMVPRAIAAFGMLGVLIHFFGIVLPAFGGYRMPFAEAFGAPLALAIVAVALWMLAKGLRDVGYRRPQASPSAGA